MTSKDVGRLRHMICFCCFCCIARLALSCIDDIVAIQNDRWNNVELGSVKIKKVVAGSIYLYVVAHGCVLRTA